MTGRSLDIAPAGPLPDEARELAGLLSQVAWFNRLRLLVAASVVWLTTGLFTCGLPVSRATPMAGTCEVKAAATISAAVRLRAISFIWL